MRKQKGITLVALVVTIIVLIILSGVSINLILGDNGLITKAQEAKEKANIESILEEVKIAVLEEEMRAASRQRTFLYENVWNKLREKDSNLQVTENIDEESYEIIYKGYKFIIDKNKNVNIQTSDSNIETKKYIITYNANGGTGTMENSETTILENSFLGEEGQNFKNWNTSSDGKGNVYNPGDKITSEANSEVTLYAQWEFDSITNYVPWFDGSDRCTEVSGGWAGGKSQGAGTVTDNSEYITFEDTFSQPYWTYLNYVAQKQLTTKDCANTRILMIFETVSPFDGNSTEWAFRILLKNSKSATNNNDWSFINGTWKIDPGTGINVRYGNLTEDNVGKYIFVQLADSTTLTPKVNLYNVSLIYNDNWERLRELAGLSSETYDTEDSLYEEEALEAIFENDNAYNYLINRCTGTFMAGFLSSDTAMEFLNNKKQEDFTRYNELRNNANWNKFLTMIEE